MAQQKKTGRAQKSKRKVTGSRKGVAKGKRKTASRGRSLMGAKKSKPKSRTRKTAAKKTSSRGRKPSNGRRVSRRRDEGQTSLPISFPQAA